MKTTPALAVLLRAIFVAAIVAASVPLAAQEAKKIPKDSLRGSITGCTRGYVFTAAARTSDEVGRLPVPEGMHLRMNGPKKLINEIKAYEGQMIQVTGLMKKDQYNQTGIGIGGGVRITPGVAPGPSSLSSAPVPSIDVESWQPVAGNCATR